MFCLDCQVLLFENDRCQFNFEFSTIFPDDEEEFWRSPTSVFAFSKGLLVYLGDLNALVLENPSLWNFVHCFFFLFLNKFSEPLERVKLELDI